MGHVSIGHEHIVVADAGDPAAPPGATIDRNKLAEHVAPADDEIGPLALELQILRNETNRGERKHPIVIADFRPPVDDRRGADVTAASDTDVGPDHRIGTDNRADSDLRAQRHVRGRINPHLAKNQSDQQLGLRDHLVADTRHGFYRCQPAPASANRDSQTKPVSWHHLTSKARVVHAA